MQAFPDSDHCGGSEAATCWLKRKRLCLRNVLVSTQIDQKKIEPSLYIPAHTHSVDNRVITCITVRINKLMSRLYLTYTETCLIFPLMSVLDVLDLGRPQSVMQHSEIESTIDQISVQINRAARVQDSHIKKLLE